MIQTAANIKQATYISTKKFTFPQQLMTQSKRRVGKVSDHDLFNLKRTTLQKRRSSELLT